MTTRCLICGNPGWHDCGSWWLCTHCAFVVRKTADAGRVAADVARQLAKGRVAFGACGDGDWRVDEGGLRNLVWAYGHEVVAIAAGTAHVRPAVARAHAVTLAIMGRAGEWEAIGRQVAALSGDFARIIVLLDGDADAAGEIAGATVAFHPLSGDFGAQRNRLQAMAGTGWVLQLDTDEMPSAALCGALGWLSAAADGDGLRSLGLPRRNLVDGILSALYPDIQYRLNRADVRYAGTVHERPVVPFAETSLALAGAIEHRLSAARVRARTRIYEGMTAGGGRPQDEAALLRRYDGSPIADR